MEFEEINSKGQLLTEDFVERMVINDNEFEALCIARMYPVYYVSILTAYIKMAKEPYQILSEIKGSALHDDILTYVICKNVVSSNKRLQFVTLLAPELPERCLRGVLDYMLGESNVPKSVIDETIKVIEQGKNYKQLGHRKRKSI